MSCLRSCPTQAIALAKKQVLAERCIHCGICISTCPEQHYQTSNLDSFQKASASPFRKIALVSPLLASVIFEFDPEQIAEAIIRLGFEQIYLADSGLKIIAEKYQEVLDRSSDFPLLTSHCPVMVEYIEKFYPDLISHLAPVVSPEMACLRYLEEISRPAQIVLIGSCPGRSYKLRNDLQAIPAITFSELRQLLVRNRIEPEKLPRKKFQNLNLHPGSALIAEGDLTKAVLGEQAAKVEAVLASGLTQARKVLDALRLGEIRSRLVELNFCPGGCIGSPVIINRLSLPQRKERAENYLKAREQTERIKLRLIPDLALNLETSFIPKRIQDLEPSAEKIKDALSSLGLGSELAIINCQACGYPSCLEFAQALIRGEAEPNYCFPALARKMTKFDERILRSERLASVGQIASALAHEVNNPLGLASGYAQTLATDKRLPLEIREIVGLIREEIENAASTIQNLLSLSRDRPIKFERVNFYEVLSATLRLVAPRLETSGISLKFNYHPNPILLECDPYGLQQVFTNLALNAGQAMQGGGTLYISVQANQDQIEISFRDTGAGIKPEHLPRLFDPFFTTKGPGEGTGLGLTIAYNIIERHQGDIRVKSELGKGAEFIITLPRSQGLTQTRTAER